MDGMRQRVRDGMFAARRMIRDDRVFGRGRAALDQPLRRTGQAYAVAVDGSGNVFVTGSHSRA